MKQKNVSTGLTWGVILGLVYCLLLFWRWNSTDSLIKFGLIALCGYLIIIGMMFFEAASRKKLDGGFISLKDLFQTLFISVLIFELIYSVYNFIHIKYIDPNVIEKMKAAMQVMIDKAGDNMKPEDAAESLKKFDKFKEATQLVPIIKGYLISVSISGIIALLISLIMRKTKPVFEENT